MKSGPSPRTNAGWIDHSRLRQHVTGNGQAKRAFATEAEAADYATRRNNARPVYRPYLCSVCNAWHVGSGNPNNTTQRKDESQ